MSRAFLITGATGHQGGSVVAALASLPGSPFTILAISRNTKSPQAQAIVERYPFVKLISSKLNDPEEIFSNSPTPVWGVYSVQNFTGNGASLDSELRQGKALVESSLRNGVNFYVYSSVDRGGQNDKAGACPVPHFETKAILERYLKERVAGQTMRYTIVRPVFFMDNFTDDMAGNISAVMWKNNVDPKRLQLVATSDIGYVTAQAFSDPVRYDGRVISLAGDELAQAEASELWGRETKKEVPLGNRLIAWALLTTFSDIGKVFPWFEEVGYDRN